MPLPKEPGTRPSVPATPWAFPVLTACILSIPVLGFGYVWDDYIFLNDAMAFRPSHLSPWHNPHDPFWRPLSRDVYFALVQGLGTFGPLFGHLLNLTMLATTIYLLVWLVSRMTDRRGGLIGGITFASLGVVPFLVGWISGIQDLLAMLFVLLAMKVRVQGRSLAALAWSACALLSKETTALFLPILACLPWIRGDSRRLGVRDLAPYAALGLVWAAVHPGIQGLIVGRFARDPNVYVGGVKLAGVALHFLRYSLTLLNLPQPDTAVTLLIGAQFALALAVGLGLTVFALRLMYRHSTGETGGDPWPRHRVLAAGLYMAVAPLLFTSAIVRGWQPYYAAVGGLGLAILAAQGLSSRAPGFVGAFLGTFLTAGVVVRSQPLDLEMTTERNFRLAAVALAKLEREFVAIQPQMPEDARVVVSTQARGVPGVYVHMYLVQALRQWYRNPSIQTVKPEVRRTRMRPESFFLVTPRLDVVVADPRRFAISPSTVPLDYSWGERAFRAYALGLFASGEPASAAAMLTHMPEVNAPLENCHHRLAAALLLASGDTSDADRILAPLPPLPRPYALENIAVFLAEPVSDHPIDEQVLRAFGFQGEDRDAWLTLVRWCAANGYPDSGLRYLRKLESLDPESGDIPALKVRLLGLERKRMDLKLALVDQPTLGSGL